MLTGPGHSALTRMPSRANCTPSSRRHREHAALGRGVGDLRGRGAHDGDEARGVDDRARLLLEHVRQGGLAAQVDGGEVDLLHPAPRVEVGVEDRVVVGRADPGVVERDVDRAVGVVRGPRTAASTSSLLGDVGVRRTCHAAAELAAPPPASSLRSATTTVAPSSANRRTVARPMPEQPPVTTATLPSSLPAMVLSYASVLMKTFLTSVNASSASGPSSRPRPDCLKPPNGVE